LPPPLTLGTPRAFHSCLARKFTCGIADLESFCRVERVSHIAAETQTQSGRDHVMASVTRSSIVSGDRRHRIIDEGTHHSRRTDGKQLRSRGGSNWQIIYGDMWTEDGDDGRRINEIGPTMSTADGLETARHVCVDIRGAVKPRLHYDTSHDALRPSCCTQQSVING